VRRHVGLQTTKITTFNLWVWAAVFFNSPAPSRAYLMSSAPHPPGLVVLLRHCVTMLPLSVSRFAAGVDHDRNEIAEQAAGEHAHEELNRW
jgi:hypothetical protein